MNNVDKACIDSKSPSEFAKKYFNYLKKVLDSIDTSSLDLIEEELENSRKNNNTFFIIGNGGSASTATTIANDLGSDIIKKTHVDAPFRILALTDNNSVMTAISNDSGYENLFLNQLKIHYRKGDKLLAISASGNSPNVVIAVEWVKSQGGRTIGFVGFNGGRLRELCDVVVHVPTEAGEYGPVEDIHLIFNHILAHWFQNIYRSK